MVRPCCSPHGRRISGVRGMAARRRQMIVDLSPFYECLPGPCVRKMSDHIYGWRKSSKTRCPLGKLNTVNAVRCSAFGVQLAQTTQHHQHRESSRTAPDAAGQWPFPSSCIIMVRVPPYPHSRSRTADRNRRAISSLPGSTSRIETSTRTPTFGAMDSCRHASLAERASCDATT